jgi:hypothetical protein
MANITMLLKKIKDIKTQKNGIWITSCPVETCQVHELFLETKEIIKSDYPKKKIIKGDFYCSNSCSKASILSALGMEPNEVFYDDFDFILKYPKYDFVLDCNDSLELIREEIESIKNILDISNELISEKIMGNDFSYLRRGLYWLEHDGVSQLSSSYYISNDNNSNTDDQMENVFDMKKNMGDDGIAWQGEL